MFDISYLSHFKRYALFVCYDKLHNSALIVSKCTVGIIKLLSLHINNILATVVFNSYY